jgi:hypothetical protein
VICSILERDIGALIYMIADYSPILTSYLEEHLGVYFNRVRIIENMKKSDYCRMLQCMDIMIDTYPFGGCNTTLDAFYYKKVVITCPSEKLNGRFTYGFYKKMNITEPICSTLDELIEKTIYYAQHTEERVELENRIFQSSSLLYEELESVMEWNSLFRSLSNRPSIDFKPFLVVSRYKEDVSFLREYPYPHMIYNKDQGENLLPNIGKCDHTYLHYIIEHYDDLPEMIVFAPASCYSNPRKKTLFNQVLYHAIINKTTVFVGKQIPDLLKGNYEFTLDKWESTNSENRTIDINLDISPIRPYGKWYETYFNESCPFITFFAIMSVHKNDILKKPRSWYQQFLNMLLTPNPEQGHYIERSWGLIFSNTKASIISI